MAKQKLNQDIYKEIRPYTDEEIPYAINRMLQSKGFITSLTNFLPDVPINVLVKKVRKIRTTEQMQKEIVTLSLAAAEKIVEKNLTSKENDKLVSDFIAGLNEDMFNGVK